MAVDIHIYGSDTLISPHTNRPFIEEGTTSTTTIFWCDRCSIKFVTPIKAIQHLGGRNHKEKLNSNDDTFIQDNIKLNRKRGFEESDVKIETFPGAVQEPKTKCSKAEDVKPITEENLICNDCSLVFTSHTTAEQHFKGKKHLAVIAVKLSSDKNPTPINKSHFCQTCNIAVNSEGQIKQHYNGLRHRINSGILPETPGWLIEQQATFNQTNTIRSSGKGLGETYRCDTCSLELNSEFQYGQHVTSLKHKQREQGKTRESGRGTTNRKRFSRHPFRGGRSMHGFGGRSLEVRGRGCVYSGRGRGAVYRRGLGSVRYGVTGYSTFRGRDGYTHIRRGWDGKQRRDVYHGFGIHGHHYG